MPHFPRENSEQWALLAAPHCTAHVSTREDEHLVETTGGLWDLPLIKYSGIRNYLAIRPKLKLWFS
jgi:hypothetical protein